MIEAVTRFFPTLLEAAIVTVEVAFFSIIVAVIVATTAGLARLSRFAIVRWVARIYVEIFRGAALLVILFWIYYVMPFFGIFLDAFTAAVIGLGLNSGAYASEIVRSAILAVPKDQYEAAKALNFTRRQQLWRVIIPQAVVMMIPPFGNMFIEIVKATSLVSLITIHEVTARAVQLNNVYLMPMEVFTLVLVIYYVIGRMIGSGMRRAERRLNLNLGRERTMA